MGVGGCFYFSGQNIYIQIVLNIFLCAHNFGRLVILYMILQF